MENLGTELNGVIFNDGAICDKPTRDFPVSFLKENTLVGDLPANELERNSTTTPALNFLFLETPVKTSSEVVKKLDRGTDAVVPLPSALVCVYKLLNHLISTFPFSNNLDGV